MTKNYDYYIEPCQLCISRKGRTYDVCGWCHDKDTHYKASDGSYAGDWISIPYGGYGYPFHELPHPTRKYYKNNSYIEFSDGKIPTDVTREDQRYAVSRNKCNEETYHMLKDGGHIIEAQIKQKDVDEFLVAEARLCSFTLKNDISSDVVGRVDFRNFTYTVAGNSIEGIVNTLLGSRDPYALLPGDSAISSVLQALLHESYHLLQGAIQQPVGYRFDSERRLSLLKTLIFQAVVMDCGIPIPYDEGILALLPQVPEDSLLYDPIARCLDSCIDDIRILSRYGCNTDFNEITIYDLIEGEAFFVQHILIGSSPLKEVENVPMVYSNAWFYYRERGGNSIYAFLLICHLSLKFGFIMEEGDLSSKSTSPLVLFTYLCEVNSTENGLFDNHCNSETADSIFVVATMLSKLALSFDRKSLAEYLSEADALVKFGDLCGLYQSIRNSIFGYLSETGLSPYEYEKLKRLGGTLDTVRAGFGAEKRAAVTGMLGERFRSLTLDTFFPLLLANPRKSGTVLLSANAISRRAEYTGPLGEEKVVSEHENEVLDLIERLNDLAMRKNVFCCDQHGVVIFSRIFDCTNKTGLQEKAKRHFSKPLTEIIG